MLTRVRCRFLELPSREVVVESAERMRGSDGGGRSGMSTTELNGRGTAQARVERPTPGRRETERGILSRAEATSREFVDEFAIVGEVESSWRVLRLLGEFDGDCRSLDGALHDGAEPVERFTQGGVGCEIGRLEDVHSLFGHETASGEADEGKPKSVRLSGRRTQAHDHLDLSIGEIEDFWRDAFDAVSDPDDTIREYTDGPPRDDNSPSRMARAEVKQLVSEAQRSSLELIDDDGRAVRERSFGTKCDSLIRGILDEHVVRSTRCPLADGGGLATPAGRFQDREGLHPVEDRVELGSCHVLVLRAQTHITPLMAVTASPTAENMNTLARAVYSSDTGAI